MSDDDHLSALWLSVLQRLTEQVAHEIRNTLNAVAVNVEVVRSRSARSGGASPVASFADVAAAQVEVLSGQVDALISLFRPPPARADLGTLLGWLTALLRGAPDKGSVEMDVPMQSRVLETEVHGTAIRLAVTAALLGAIEGGRAVVCRLGTESPPRVYIAGNVGGPVSLAYEIADAVTRAGIQLDTLPHGIMISFPTRTKG